MSKEFLIWLANFTDDSTDGLVRALFDLQTELMEESSSGMPRRVPPGKFPLAWNDPRRIELGKLVESMDDVCKNLMEAKEEKA